MVDMKILPIVFTGLMSLYSAELGHGEYQASKRGTLVINATTACKNKSAHHCTDNFLDRGANGFRKGDGDSYEFEEVMLNDTNSYIGSIGKKIDDTKPEFSEIGRNYSRILNDVAGKIIEIEHGAPSPGGSRNADEVNATVVARFLMRTGQSGSGSVSFSSELELGNTYVYLEYSTAKR